MKYETHITINTNNKEKFIKDCIEIGVKPIVIETQNHTIFHEQVMTSSITDTFNPKSISKLLIERGYDIIREKVEINPLEEKHNNHCYYESHFRLKLPKDFNYDVLEKICEDNNAHLSKNLFKSDDQFNYQMVTIRYNDLSFLEFNDKINQIKIDLDYNIINYDKIEIEECIYDTNINVDNNWIIPN